MSQNDIACAEPSPVRVETSCDRAQSRFGPNGRPLPAASSNADLHPSRAGAWPSLMVGVIACALLAAIGWRYVEGRGACRPMNLRELRIAGGWPIDAVARRIVFAESTGDPLAKNERSSATGTGQFLEATWLDLIHAARPDLVGLPDEDVLELRRDPDLSRELTSRLARRNAAMLASHCLPVTAGTIYLSHFAGGAGAVAVLTAPESADAATTMARADATGRTTREKIVTANPFLQRFTVADLRSWADRKMRRTAEP
jgi:hypothetical protein